MRHATLDAQGRGTLFIFTHDYPITDALTMLELLRQAQAMDASTKFSIVSSKRTETRIQVLYEWMGLMHDVEMLYNNDGNTVQRAADALRRGRHVILHLHADRIMTRQGYYRIQERSGARVVLVRVPHARVRFLPSLDQDRAFGLVTATGLDVDVEFEPVTFQSLEDARQKLQAMLYV